jgi:Leucine-rich repeat (LRR) protein
MKGFLMLLTPLRRCLPLVLLSSLSMAGQCSPRGSQGQIQPLPNYESLEEAIPALLLVQSREDCGAFLRFQETRELDLRDRGVTQLAFLQCLPELRSLNLEANNLDSIVGITESPLLELLILRKNKLTSLDALKGLTKLKELDVSFNAITDVDALSAVNFLETIDASANQLQSIQGLLDLPALSYVDVSYNPLPDTEVDKLRQRGVYLVSYQD